MRSRTGVWVLGALLTAAAALPASAAADGAPPVTIRTTGHGIPHIIAGGWAGLG